MIQALFPIGTEADSSLLRNTPGFYKFVDAQGEAKYVGSTTNLQRRLHVHNHSLRQGTHPNRALQKYVDEQGPLQFIPQPLTSREEALEMEQAWLDDPQVKNQLLNVASDARSPFKGGLARGHKQSPEHIQARLQHRLGVPLSNQTKERIAVQVSKPVIVGETEFASGKDAAAHFGITSAAVTYRCSSNNFPEWRKKTNE